MDSIVDGTWYIYIYCVVVVVVFFNVSVFRRRHTIMFAKRGDKFCAATAYDSGPTSPASLPAGSKSALIVYNLGCELPPGVALTVLLNGVVVWPSVKSMSRGEPLQFASGLYSYDAFATTSDMSSVSMPGILESGSGGKRSLEFRPRTLYRAYFARIQGAATALMELAANDTLKLPADLERDDAVVKSFDPQKWLIDNAVLAGAIGGAILCIRKASPSSIDDDGNALIRSFVSRA